jgi:hypothetical protein
MEYELHLINLQILLEIITIGHQMAINIISTFTTFESHIQTHFLIFVLLFVENFRSSFSHTVTLTITHSFHSSLN